jgi:hypothetical protein
MFQLCLIKLLSSGQSPADGNRWATYQTECGSRIVFWGSPDKGNVNVNLLKHQVFPVVIDIEEDLDNCLASSSVRQRYKCSFSVSEETRITILSGDAKI